MIKFFRKAALTLTFLPAIALSQGALENPASLTTESGVGIISGWHCTAREVEALVDNVSIGYTYVGSDRSDTKTVCNGVSATGFALLTNFNVFTPGLHNLKVLADGQQFGEVNFTTVKSGGVEYLTDVSKQAVITDFPTVGSTATLNWNQSKQSFVVTAISNNTSSQDNVAPVANAGVTQSVTNRTVVILDGSASSDADGDSISYSWSLTTKPVGSTAVLTNPMSVKPSFVPDLVGSYIATLIVDDGKMEGALATVSIIANPAATSSDAIEAVKVKVSESRTDPSSTIFRNMRTYRMDSDITVCGEFNTKNSFGGYDGYESFYYRLYQNYLVKKSYLSSSVELSSLRANLFSTICSDATDAEVKAEEYKYNSALSRSLQAAIDEYNRNH